MLESMVPYTVDAATNVDVPTAFHLHSVFILHLLQEVHKRSRIRTRSASEGEVHIAYVHAFFCALSTSNLCVLTLLCGALFLLPLSVILNLH